MLKLLLLCLTLLATTCSGFSTLRGGGCNDTADLVIFNHTWTTFHASVEVCAKNCWAELSCTAKCIVKSIGLTTACAQCFAADVYCTAENCASECIVDPDSKACKDCSQKYCGPALVTCSGVPQNKLPS